MRIPTTFTSAAGLAVISTLAVLIGVTCNGAAQVAVSTSGYATAAGPAIPTAPPDAKPDTVPQISFINISPSPVGATNATGNNVAGASNSTIGNVPPLSFASMSVPVYTTGVPSLGGYEPGMDETATEQTVAPRAAPFDLGVTSGFSGNSSAPATSIAEVARTSRREQLASRAVRTYTDADFEPGEQGAKPPSAGYTVATATPTSGGATGMSFRQQHPDTASGGNVASVGSAETPNPADVGVASELPAEEGTADAPTNTGEPEPLNASPPPVDEHSRHVHQRSKADKQRQ